MLNTPPQLTPRLLKIADLIHPCNCMADIGTDHAYLPVYLCMTNKCKTAIASDIRKGPLQRAASTVSKYNCTDIIETRLGGGVSTITANEAESIVIAGMGGLIISQILSEGFDIVTSAKQIILQPMTATEELREYLSSNGFEIIGEYLAKEDAKIYNILSVRYSGISYSLSEVELYLGKDIKENNPELFPEYLEKKKKKLVNMIKGLELAVGSDSTAKLDKTKYLLSALENF